MPCPYYSYSSGLFSGSYHCDKKNSDVNDDTYYKYCRGHSYSDCSIYKQTESSGCFLTTVTCQILGHNDNNEVLNSLRIFRDEVLQKDSEYYDILKEYDHIGPIIADRLYNDENSLSLANVIYQNGILPICQLIKQKDYQSAVEKYYLMTLLLINYYGLKHEYNDRKDNNYNNAIFNPNTAGHGRKLILKKETIKSIE